MKDIIKDTLTYALLIGVSLLLLLIFILIARYGAFVVYEPNKIILITDIAICVGMLALGIERLRSLIKTRRK